MAACRPPLAALRSAAALTPPPNLSAGRRPERRNVGNGGGQSTVGSRLVHAQPNFRVITEGECWRFRLSGGVRENVPGLSHQPDQQFLSAADRWSVADFAFAALGIGFDALGVGPALGAEARIIQRRVVSFHGFADALRGDAFVNSHAGLLFRLGGVAGEDGLGG